MMRYLPIPDRGMADTKIGIMVKEKVECGQYL